MAYIADNHECLHDWNSGEQARDIKIGLYRYHGGDVKLGLNRYKRNKEDELVPGALGRMTLEEVKFLRLKLDEILKSMEQYYKA